ncbi:zinc-dependent alcohol dehydrogenase [Arenibaculum sp.]|uniref:zinc-dependent alcohol dehydrogenase n=1 Tax=Arenibaculum sp. TaxID=2865862 RepID=UPI002E10EEF1|nr:zinc-dependent alcohol dehydrogenase [Arenibaculum sp.]
MKAVVFHGVGDIRVDDVPEPKIQDPTDAIVRITASAICGTDLHMIRGTLPGMKPGTILGHEGVGVVEEVGPLVRNLKQGDRVVIPSTIGCGSCNYCRSGYFAQCDTANPNGSLAGTAFYGGPQMTGPFDGLQAEYARVPYAATNLVKLPDGVSDDQAILISDIYPTGFFGAHLAEIKDGDIVAVWGCGPVGLFAILSARQLGASRIIAVDGIPSRLERARALGAEVVNFNEEDPVDTIRKLTGGIGTDRAIDAVGVDSERPKSGPAAEEAGKRSGQFQQELQQIAPETNPQDGVWKPGDAPSLASTWAVQALAKAGTLAVIGVYPQTDRFFPIGMAMNKNLTINMGNCNHRKYVPELVAMVEAGAVDPLQVLSHVEPMSDVIEAYRQFDQRKPGWVKVELVPGL